MLLDPLVQILRRHQEDGFKVRYFQVMEGAFGHSSTDLELVRQATRDAVGLHYGEIRKSNEPYDWHPKSAGIIQVEYLGRQDAEEVATALLHDGPEHHPETWTLERLKKNYSTYVTDSVWSCNRLRYAYIEDPVERNHEFLYQLLNNGSVAACVAKLAERLHNGLTSTTEDLADSDWVQRKIREIRSFYIPIARKHQVLYREMIALLEALEQRKCLLPPLSKKRKTAKK